MIKLEVKAETPKNLDSIQPFLDFPVAAIRTPPILVERNNLIRISVLIKRVFPTAAGAGGVIVRDSIGGEQFQFRSAGAIPEYQRLLLFRKAPTNDPFTVTLGLAGYGEAYFDDLRVEVVEQDDARAGPDLVRRSDQDRPMRGQGPRTRQRPKRPPGPETPHADRDRRGSAAADTGRSSASVVQCSSQERLELRRPDARLHHERCHIPSESRRQADRACRRSPQAPGP